MENSDVFAALKALQQETNAMQNQMETRARLWHQTLQQFQTIVDSRFKELRSPVLGSVRTSLPTQSVADYSPFQTDQYT